MKIKPNVDKLNKSKANKNEDYHIALILAGLLHDIGHGPFSHAIEGCYKDIGITHEDFSRVIIKKITKNDKNSLGKNLQLAEKILFDEKLKPEFLHDIISSSLDADRMDYLLRDAHYCGVEYGKYDPNWIIHNLTISHNHLGIELDGISTVEQILFARRLMNKQVYLHKKKSTCELLFAKFLLLFRELISIKYVNKNKIVKLLPCSKSLVNFFIKHDEIKNKSNHGDVSKNKISQNEKICLANDLLKDFLALTENNILRVMEFFIDKNNVNKFKKTLSSKALSECKKAIDNMNILSNMILTRNLPQVYYVAPSLESDLKDSVTKYANEYNLNEEQISVNKPDFVTYKSKAPIYVNVKPIEQRTLITELSYPLKALSDTSEDLLFVYFDKNLKEAQRKKIKNKLEKAGFIRTSN